MQSLEEAKSYLQTVDPKGRSVYDHLTSLLANILQHQPDDPLAVLENLSVQIKSGAYTPGVVSELPPTPITPDETARLLAAVEETMQLVRPGKRKELDTGAPKPKADEEDEDEEDEEDEEDDDKEPAEIPNLMQQAQLLQWGGVRLGDEEVYQIMLSIQKLATDKELTDVRFFGKILGTEADYVVCESAHVAAEEEEEEEEDEEALERKKKENPDLFDDRAEDGGVGANAKSYWVTTNVAAGVKAWTKLPDVQAQQIITARQVRRFFTGRLDAAVAGHPRFPWGEASLLRAQIARIVASTSVSPAGYFQTGDGEDEEEDEEEQPTTVSVNPEYEGASAADLLTADAWCHHSLFLLKQGRTTIWQKPEEDEDEDEDEDAESKAGDGAEEEEEEDEPPALLETLENDTAGKAKFGAVWSFRACPQGRSADNPPPHAAVAAVSNTWPGAVAVARGKEFANVYVGYGLKRLGEKYTPPPMPPVQNEFVADVQDEDEDEDEEQDKVFQEQTDPLPPPPEEESKDDEDEDDEDDEDEE